MTIQAAVAAADRATSAAVRLAALRERAGQLSAGGPISIEHLLEARAWAEPPEMLVEALNCARLRARVA